MNIGLIGCGRVASLHMNAYRSIRDAKVLAVSDVNLGRAKAFAESHKIDRVFSNYADLLEVKDIDLVDICTPTLTHATIACDVANADRNILLEKPMGRNSEECERIMKQSEKHGVRLCICHNQLFYPFVKQLKSIADSGSFNMTSLRTVHRESFEFLKAHGLAHDWNVSPEQGGILWEVGYHLAYLQLHFMKDIKDVCAVGVKAKHPVYDEFAVVLRTSSQRYGIMEVSWVSKESEIMYEINNSDGRRVQAYLPHGYIIEKSEKPPASITSVLRSFYVDEKRVFTKWKKFGMTRVRKQPFGHDDLIASYLESLKKDAPPPIMPEDGRNAIRLLECIERSIDERRSVSVNF